MNYVISEAVPPRGVCRLDIIQNVPEAARLQKGTRQLGRFPADAYFRMSENFPKDIKLADALSNANNLLVASERLVELLNSCEALERNDVYEVGILNHKARREKAKYFVVHQYGFPKCVDEKKTVGKKSRVNPDEYIALDKLVLNESKIDSNLALFRPLEYNQRPFFRRDVAEKIAAANITGIEFFEIDEYDDF
ncbi:MAG: hypothetical protein Q8K82_21875 [Gemmatimonadaceae bacterium]|nr:hypothetical protein [Gemmatimonadaceae bacterium]